MYHNIYDGPGVESALVCTRFRGERLRTVSSQHTRFPHQSRSGHRLNERLASAPKSPSVQTGKSTDAGGYKTSIKQPAMGLNRRGSPDSDPIL